MWHGDDDSIYRKRFVDVARLSQCQSAIVYIHPKLKEKIEHVIDMADGEVGGLGKIVRVESHGTKAFYLVQSVDLIEQDGSAAEVQLDSVEVVKWMEKNYPGWREAEDKPALFFWHSHVNFSTHFSPQDDAAIAGLAQMGGVVLSVVGNKRREWNARMDFVVPVRNVHIEMPAEFKDQPLTWLNDKDRKAIEREFAQNVRERKGGEGTSYFLRERERLEKQAEGTDKIAQAAKDKLVELDEEEKRYKGSSKGLSMYKITKNNKGEVERTYPKTATDRLSRRCAKCGGYMDAYEGEDVTHCWSCRSKLREN